MSASSSSQLVLYPALTKDKIEELKRMGLTDEMMPKAHEAEKKHLDEKEKKMTLSIRGPQSDARNPLKLLLMGHTGVGKSATGNLITGKGEFEESDKSTSCTKTVSKSECEVDGIKVMVMDTPGFNDTSVIDEAILTELAKVVEFYRHGIDGILFLFNYANPRFTKEQKAVFDRIFSGVLGKEFINKCFVIITFGNVLASKQTLAQKIAEESENDFGKLLTEIAKQHVIAVDNSDTSVYGRQIQREQVVRLVASDKLPPCTPAVFAEFLKHHEERVKMIPAGLQHLANEIEGMVYEKLEPLVRKDILALTNDEKLKIVNEITNSIHATRNPYGGNINELLDAVHLLSDGVQERLTSHWFLQSLKDFWQYLLGAIGSSRF